MNITDFDDRCKGMGKADAVALIAGLAALIGMMIIEVLLWIGRTRKMEIMEQRQRKKEDKLKDI